MSPISFEVLYNGRVFGLSTDGTKWREFIYPGLEFKQLSAVPHFLWALGGDGQVYVHVHGLDKSIRMKEVAYENERWTPFEGFTKRLLPTDPYQFSNQDGTKDRTLENIRLPSMAWQWEGDWQLQLTLDGQPLDHDGWTYAFDFSATYYPKKQWSSHVRRRKWIRYRRYSALNSWCVIAPLHEDPTREPFIGVSVGGNQVPGGKPGMMSVWAVTAHGRVVFRTDVSNFSPEGERWDAITMPQGCQVSQISVGPTGLVWVVLRNGKALVRTGITRENLTGESWIEVEQPGKNVLLKQVSVGCNGLWAITRDNRVWFRKGIRGESSGVSEELARGSGWLEVIGRMASVSVASNDQVWAVGAEDGLLYFRSAVTHENLTGKNWCLIEAPTQHCRTNSTVSLFSGGSVSETPKEEKHRSWTSLELASHRSKMTSKNEHSEAAINKNANDNDLARKRKVIYERGADATLEFSDGGSIRINKTLLAIESERFNDIFFGSSPCTNVKVEDFDYETFQTFLDCLFELKEYSALDALVIYPIAHKYNVKKCLQKCVSVLQPVELNENVCLTLNLASFYNDQLLLDAIFRFLRLNILPLLDDKKYLDLLEPSAISAIVENMNIRFKNSYFWRILYQWGENYNKKQGSPKITDVLLLFKENNIFPHLSLDCFESVQSIFDFHDFSKQELLDSKEILNLIKKNLLEKRLPERSYWIDIKKGEKVTEIIKFKHSYKVTKNKSGSFIFDIVFNKILGDAKSSFSCDAEYIAKNKSQNFNYCSRDWPSNPNGAFNEFFSLKAIPVVKSLVNKISLFRASLPVLPNSDLAIKGLKVNYNFSGGCKILKTSTEVNENFTSRQLCFTRKVNVSFIPKV